MADHPHIKLELVARHLPDEPPAGGDGHGGTGEVGAGVYQIGALVGDTFLPLATIKAGHLEAPLEELAGKRSSSSSGKSSG